MKFRAVLFSFLFPAAFATEAGATIVTFSDRITWQAAAGATTLDDLNDLATAASPVSTGSIDAGDFTIRNTGTFLTVFGASIIDGTIAGNVSTSARNGLIFEFDDAISAFGLDLLNWNDDILRTEVFADSQPVPVTVQDGPGERFFGLTSSDAFTAVSFEGISGVSGDAWTFDNVAYSGVTSSITVPVPATLALLVLGLLGMKLQRRS